MALPTPTNNEIEMVELRIKSASNRCDDLIVDSELSNTVKQLKEKIRQNYPLHPDTRDQRLIFAGHLLEDNQILRDILLPNSAEFQKSFTLHLVCNSKINSRAPNQSFGNYEPKNIPLSASVPTVNLNSGPSSSMNHLNQPIPHEIPNEMVNGNDYQQYVQNMMNAMAMNNQWPQFNPYFYNPYQYPTGMFYPPNTPIFQNAANTGVEEVNQQIQAARAAQHQQQQQQQDQVAQQQPPRPVPEDEEQQRDLLDWMYTFSRIVLIFSVVYFYANFTRFFLVVTFTALVMIFQRRQAANPPPPVADVQPQVQPQNREQQNANANAQQENNGPAAAGNEPRAAVGAGDGVNPEQPAVTERIEAQAPLIHARNVTWTFLTTFFTSLIPEINQN